MWTRACDEVDQIDRELLNLRANRNLTLGRKRKEGKLGGLRSLGRQSPFGRPIAGGERLLN
jgi:hypothetical protein